MERVHPGAWRKAGQPAGVAADVLDADHDSTLGGRQPGQDPGHALVPDTPRLPAGNDEKGHAVITFEDVTKRYPGGTVAVDDISLEVPAGQTMVLVGPSGGGKTTTLRMINRLIDPTSGRILLDGKDIQRSNPAQLRRGIGYVIQQVGLFPHRTVLDNIATVPLLTGWGKPKARERARELMDLVGLDPQLARRYPHHLPRGRPPRARA